MPPIPFPRTLKGVEVQCNVYLMQLSEQWGSESHGENIKVSCWSVCVLRVVLIAQSNKPPFSI